MMIIIKQAKKCPSHTICRQTLVIDILNENPVLNTASKIQEYYNIDA
jgi:hypothetical protein